MLRRDLSVIFLGILPSFFLSAYAADHGLDLVKQQQAVNAYGQLSLSFTANQGQYDPPVTFEARGSGYSIALTHHEAIFHVAPSHQRSHSNPGGLQPARGDESVGTAHIRMQFPGASKRVAVSGSEELPGKANFLIGNNVSKWRTQVPTYSKVKYTGLYPGIDLIYYGNQKQLEFDFVIQPGADPNTVKLHFQNDFSDEPISRNISDTGDLLIGEQGRQVRFPKPVVYQFEGDTSEQAEKHLIDASYVLSGTNEVRFLIGTYDKHKTLVIDPTVVYSATLGGNIDDVADAIAVDSAGNAYITGQTSSSNFPRMSGSLKSGEGIGFVCKLNSTGTALVYSTFLGGSHDSDAGGRAIAVDASGHAFIFGGTFSTDFPTTPGAYQTQGTGAYVSKLNPAGSGLIYSTLLNGGQSYVSFVPGNGGIAIDSAGNAYVTGTTTSTTFPTTVGAYQASPGTYTQNFQSAFLTKFNASGSTLVYSTYLGGETTTGNAVTVDKTGAAYVTGTTTSKTFPVTSGALSATGNGFVTKFNPAGTALLYSTFLPGSKIVPNAISLDAAGSAYITGDTQGGSIVTTPGAFQMASLSGYYDAFVMKLNSTGAALAYSTYLGGDYNSEGYGVAADARGNAYVVGTGGCRNFPVTAGAFQSACGGGADGFFTEVNPTGSALLYSTFLGGSDTDIGSAVAVDPMGNAYVAGYTFDSTTFPTTTGALEGPGFDADVFVTKFSPTPIGTTSQSITFGFLANQVYGAGQLTLNAAASSGLLVIYNATGPVTLQGNKLNILGAGTVTVTASQAGNTTYAAAAPVTRSFTVTKAVLQVTANNVTRFAGLPNPALAYTLTGFINAGAIVDGQSVVGGSATLTTTATSASAPGAYSITFATKLLTAANYTFTYIPGTLTVTVAQCQTINKYATGFTSAGLSLNNGATITANLLQLTDGGIFEGRSAFYTTPVLITEFATDFTFQLVNPVADGITFTVQSNNATIHGHSGGDLGYTGIPNSAAVKFDLHNNRGEGQDSMGFYQDGVPPTTPDVNLVPAGIDLHSGHIFHVHINYVNANTTVTISDAHTGKSTSQAFPGDLSASVGTVAYVGFTAGTGEGTATQDILTWSYAGGPGCSNPALAK